MFAWTAAQASLLNLKADALPSVDSQSETESMATTSDSEYPSSVFCHTDDGPIDVTPLKKKKTSSSRTGQGFPMAASPWSPDDVQYLPCCQEKQLIH